MATWPRLFCFVSSFICFSETHVFSVKFFYFVRIFYFVFFIYIFFILIFLFFFCAREKMLAVGFLNFFCGEPFPPVWWLTTSRGAARGQQRIGAAAVPGRRRNRGVGPHRALNPWETIASIFFASRRRHTAPGEIQLWPAWRSWAEPKKNRPKRQSIGKESGKCKKKKAKKVFFWLFTLEFWPKYLNPASWLWFFLLFFGSSLVQLPVGPKERSPLGMLL